MSTTLLRKEALRSILTLQTDDAHPLRPHDLIAGLKNLGFTATENTLAQDIDALNKEGMGVYVYRDPQNSTPLITWPIENRQQSFNYETL